LERKELLEMSQQLATFKLRNNIGKNLNWICVWVDDTVEQYSFSGVLEDKMH